MEIQGHWAKYKYIYKYECKYKNFRFKITPTLFLNQKYCSVVGSLFYRFVGLNLSAVNNSKLGAGRSRQCQIQPGRTSNYCSQFGVWRQTLGLFKPTRASNRSGTERSEKLKGYLKYKGFIFRTYVWVVAEPKALSKDPCQGYLESEGNWGESDASSPQLRKRKSQKASEEKDLNLIGSIKVEVTMSRLFNIIWNQWHLHSASAASNNLIDVYTKNENMKIKFDS